MLTIGSTRIECPVLGGRTKSHIVCGHIIGSGNVPDDSLRGSDAHVSDEGKEPSKAGDGSPYDRVRIPL